MRVFIALQHRCLRLPDGTVWTQTMFPYAFWQRYLTVFDQVRLLTRVQEVRELPDGWVRFDGEDVSVAPVPSYVGPAQCLLHAREVRRAGQQAVNWCDAVIMRIPAHGIAASVESVMRRTGHPYAVEVVADPHELFAPGCIQHPARPYLRRALTTLQQRQCAGASAALYVTQASLQRRYPCPGHAVGLSDVEITADALAVAPRPPRLHAPYTVLSVGTMQQVYKGFDVLIDAVARCVRHGVDLRLVLVGDGRYRPALARQATRLGLEGRVCFTGEVTMGSGVRRLLDDADLFVLPSRSEGCPRALIEAMARALPCLGSEVGGIPELLASADLVPVGQAHVLADRMLAVLADPVRMSAMSARNLAKAREFHDNLLGARRAEFYRAVRAMTEKWLHGNTRVFLARAV